MRRRGIVLCRGSQECVTFPTAALPLVPQEEEVEEVALMASNIQSDTSLWLHNKLGEPHLIHLSAVSPTWQGLARMNCLLVHLALPGSTWHHLAPPGPTWPCHLAHQAHPPG